jgi:cytosine/uracil/thiamine/allantoin permease
VIPGFARAVVTPGGTVADPNLFDRLYSYAWFVTFGLSFVAYLALMRTARITPTASQQGPGHAENREVRIDPGHSRLRHGREAGDHPRG